jgi:hypothetical protein
MKLFYSIAVSAAVFLSSLPSRAGLRNTSVGPVDSSCVTDVPNGATIDTATGMVTLVDGSSYATASCGLSWTATYPPTPPSVGGGGYNPDWAMFNSAYPISNEGEEQFDDIEQYIIVPDAPADPSNGAVQFLWCGLENLTSSGDWLTVIQPEIVWGDNRQEWVLQTQYVPNNTYISGNLIQSGQEPVNPGDEIFCQVWQIGSSEWKINAVDETTGAYSVMNLDVPTSGYGSYPYNWALIAVYEPQGLQYCNGLPSQDFAQIKGMPHSLLNLV